MILKLDYAGEEITRILGKVYVEGYSRNAHGDHDKIAMLNTSTIRAGLNRYLKSEYQGAELIEYSGTSL